MNRSASGRMAVVVLAATLLGAAPLRAQTRVLRGRVVALNRASVQGLRLRIVGYGDPVIGRSGEFVQEIPARGVDALTFVSLDSAWAIVYPPDGRVSVPQADEPLLVMVGEPVDRTITRALADRRRQSEQLLAELGVQSGRLGGVEQQMQEALRLLRLKESDLVDAVALRQQRDSLYVPLSAAINGYVLAARDLASALRVLNPVLDGERAVLQAALAELDSAIVRYNRAYEPLRTGRNGFETGVERNWTAGPSARRDLADFYDNVLEPLHRGRILPAGEVLTVVKQGLGSGRRDERFREARADLARRTAELSAEMERLDARAVRLLEQLRPD